MTARNPSLLFVYGTLREDPENDMYHVLARNASFLGEGSVQGRLYNLWEYPAMVLSDHKNEKVLGEVYSLLPEKCDDTLRTLDDYEGLGPTDPLPHEYKRQVVTVNLASGGAVDAWAYLLNRETEGLKRIASDDYLAWRRKSGCA